MHSYSYSIIALQELNLNYFYPSIYWNTACLTVESSSDEENDKDKNTNYGKIAKAIYKMKKFGTDVLPPDINKSNISFTPIEETNEILFGLGGIAKINNDIASLIIEKRPYKNFKDFFDKHYYKGSPITKSIIINLIKSGAFIKTDGNPIPTMKWFCYYLHDNKQSLTMNNVENILDDMSQELANVYYFKKYNSINKKLFYCNDNNFKSKKHYKLNREGEDFFRKHYIDFMQEGRDYYYADDSVIVIDKELEKAMKQDLDKIKNLLKDPIIVEKYNKKMLNQEYQEMIKGVEDINKWSFETVCFYGSGDHELSNVNFEEYNISNFSDLPEEPLFNEMHYGKRSWKQYKINRICGTVLDRNDNNHLVDILTPDNEVVTLNIPQGQYSYYKQTITTEEEKDSNWLYRGNLIVVCGYRRGNAFFVKNYKNTVYQHSMGLIKKVNEDNSLDLQLERLGEENE